MSLPSETEITVSAASEPAVRQPADKYDFAHRATKLAEDLSAYRQQKNRTGQARTLIALGSLVRNTADYAGALNYILEAEEICEGLGDATLVRGVVGQLFCVHMDLGNLETALTLANQAVELAHDCDDPEERLNVLNSLGCVLGQMGHHQEGINKLNEAHGLVVDIKDAARRSHIESQSFADHSDAYFDWGKADQAYHYAEEGARIASESGNDPLLQLSLRYAGRAARAMGKPEVAVEKLERALAMATRMGLKSQESRTGFDLSEALADLGKDQKALACYRRAHQLQQESSRDEANRRSEFQRVKQNIDEARRETESVERLLFSVLPRGIATRIRAGESRIADDIPDASILFADLVGFTSLSATMPPKELLARLEWIFSRFDTLTTTYQLEKIKTIGDAYMVVGGALHSNTDHLDHCAHLAFDMLRTMEELRQDEKISLAIRVGLHAGPAIAGVIGQSKLSYDLWGETVNIASRLESTGSPGRVHVSSHVAERLRDRFQLEPRGLIELKGLGSVETYFLDAL